ncbi:MAG: hypothetical protein NPIRA06_06250 [Nitrospirales bacterium]|nr:MAG: hypothetical protein NPIRA06_06250 [Nitrospirales bacterium]
MHTFTIVYRDQALFVRQGLFTQLGGYPMQAVLKDVVLGQSLLTGTTHRPWTLTVITDSWKIVKMGIWRSFIRVLMIILHVEFGLPKIFLLLFSVTAAEPRSLVSFC